MLLIKNRSLLNERFAIYYNFKLFYLAGTLNLAAKRFASGKKDRNV